MKSLTLNNDRYHMNWVEGRTEWGTVRTPPGLAAQVSRRTQGDLLWERYTFTNTTGRELFLSLRDVGIYTPFNDDYTSSAICMTNRCHTHIWCAEEVSCVMALRMGGEGPHLGLVLTEGSLGGYSVERNLGKACNDRGEFSLITAPAGSGNLSNDRGDFILHPAPAALAPGGSFAIEWVLFPHQGKEDFARQLGELSPHWIDVQAQQYTLFEGERIQLEITPRFAFDWDSVSLELDGEAVPFTRGEGRLLVDQAPRRLGEHRFEIQVGKTHTHCSLLVLPPLEQLAQQRCRFIAQKQQYHRPGSALDGAYLIYDTEEGHIHYDPENDRNGGRERIAMGALLAKYLQTHKDEALEHSLRQYMAYVDRELVDRETGVVYNDCRRDSSLQRLYNYPWAAVFYLELYALYGEESYLVTAYRVMREFYARGGGHFYAIGVPLARILRELEPLPQYREELLECFRAHCDEILRRRTDYPAHEVNFEQSIVAPAADLLLQMYQATGEEKYLTGGRRQLEILSLFNGRQPDYHLYEVAIRHWDGFWFGKGRLFGDTFPHYWSALSANVYQMYGQITGDPTYLEAAEAAYRGVLSLFFPDGSASCAYLYPVSVSGQPGRFADPYANDQDWGLYYMLCHRG